MPHSWQYTRPATKFHNPFVRVINGLLWVEKIDLQMLEQVIFCAYRICIDHVIQKLSSSHLATLSLWSDFVVYVDNSSASETKQAVDSFRDVIQRSEEDDGVDDDFTLEILGLTLYVLQSTQSTTAEAELVALDMLRRVNRRAKWREIRGDSAHLVERSKTYSGQLMSCQGRA
jgi:hypothetical protein